MDPHPASNRKYKIIGFDPSPYLSSACILMSYRSYRHICLVLPCCEFQTTCWTQEPLHRLKPANVRSIQGGSQLGDLRSKNLKIPWGKHTKERRSWNRGYGCSICSSSHCVLQLLKHQSAGLQQTLALPVQFLHCQVACFGVEHVSATGSLASPANSSMKIKGLNWQ